MCVLRMHWHSPNIGILNLDIPNIDIPDKITSMAQ